MKTRTIYTTLYKVLKLAFCGSLPIQPKGIHYKEKFPATPKQLKKKGLKWVERALKLSGALVEDNSITKLDISELGAIGLLGDLRVIDVVYAKPTDLPTKMIVKFAPPDFSARLLTDLFDLSRAEINFYQKMQSDLSIVDTPRCFFTDFDPLSNRYVLIIEHLTHTRRASFRDFLKPNCVSIEEAKMCMAQLARLHAKFWGKGGTEKAPWLNRADNKLVEDLIPMQEKIMWGKFSTKTQGGTTPKDWSYEIPKELVEYWPKVRKNTFLYMSRLESHPFRTCIHGDTRLDNWFFYDDAKGEAQAGLIDWQLISVGVSVQDLSWFFLGSVDEEFCQKHEEDLLDTYLKELNSNLEENIDSEAFYEEYALSYFHAVVKSMMACNKVSKGDERDIRICDKMMVGALNGMKRRNTWEAFDKMEGNKLRINHGTSIDPSIIARRKDLAHAVRVGNRKSIAHVTKAKVVPGGA